MFTENEVYFPSPNAFNDPFDCKFGCSFGKEFRDAQTYVERTFKTRYPNLNRQQRRARASGMARNIIDPSARSQIASGRDKIIAELGV